jgi:hypothetical protein
MPDVKKYLDDYGFEDGILDKVFDVKSDGAHMKAFAWKTETGMVDYFTVERGGYDEPWDMLNDGHEEIPEAKWKKAYIPEECNWVEFKE